ncbi:hypothetical protein VTN49DRAFT_3054 [Thermomyces lanuginosus]|uniref:uncharacterized protein n=1 Tax=Thermomyces lanuginosus TaxID=5541 RepID=UPI003743C245
MRTQFTRQQPKPKFYKKNTEPCATSSKTSTSTAPAAIPRHISSALPWTGRMGVGVQIARTNDLSWWLACADYARDDLTCWLMEHGRL